MIDISGFIIKAIKRSYKGFASIFPFTTMTLVIAAIVGHITGDINCVETFKTVANDILRPLFFGNDMSAKTLYIITAIILVYGVLPQITQIIFLIILPAQVINIKICLLIEIATWLVIVLLDRLDCSYLYNFKKDVFIMNHCSFGKEPNEITIFQAWEISIAFYIYRLSSPFINMRLYKAIGILNDKTLGINAKNDYNYSKNYDIERLHLSKMANGDDVGRRVGKCNPNYDRKPLWERRIILAQNDMMIEYEPYENIDNIKNSVCNLCFVLKIHIMYTIYLFRKLFKMPTTKMTERQFYG